MTFNREPIRECDCSRANPTFFTVTISDALSGACCWEGAVGKLADLTSTPAGGAG